MSSRKNISLVIGIALIAVMTGGAAIAGAAQHITFGTASPTGGWMMLASSVSKIINESLPAYSVTPVPSPRGSMENIETIASGERELGLTMSNIALLGIKGEEPFKAPHCPMAQKLYIYLGSPAHCIVHSPLDKIHIKRLVFECTF